MNWQKVAAKLRAISDQHAREAESDLLRGNKNNAERSHHLSQIFYGLTTAIEAGTEE